MLGEDLLHCTETNGCADSNECDVCGEIVCRVCSDDFSINSDGIVWHGNTCSTTP